MQIQDQDTSQTTWFPKYIFFNRVSWFPETRFPEIRFPTVRYGFLNMRFPKDKVS